MELPKSEMDFNEVWSGFRIVCCTQTEIIISKKVIKLPNTAGQFLWVYMDEDILYSLNLTNQINIKKVWLHPIPICFSFPKSSQN